MLGTTLPTPMYALYAERMHFAVLTTTVIYATYAGGVLFALLAFGRWSDAVGRRPILAAGLVAALASAVVFLTADSVPQLLVGRVLSGLSAGLFTGTATAAVIEAAPPKWRGRAAAVATVANIGGDSHRGYGDPRCSASLFVPNWIDHSRRGFRHRAGH
jgi:MFS family permease